MQHKSFCFYTSEIQKMKTVFSSFVLHSVCTIFSEHRLHLGNTKDENCVFLFCTSLGLHYLCTLKQ